MEALKELEQQEYKYKPKMISKNKKIGNAFEQKFCEVLYEHGFWAHNLAQNASGQPADIIAARNGITYLIDCKICSNRRFALSRMEENQDLSMELWESCGNGNGWFAVLIGEEITMLPHFVIKNTRNQQSCMNEVEIKNYGTPFEEWLKWSEK